ncbi:hypothetical protein [Amycolatopsis sp. NPDC051061]
MRQLTALDVQFTPEQAKDAGNEVSVMLARCRRTSPTPPRGWPS